MLLIVGFHVVGCLLVGFYTVGYTFGWLHGYGCYVWLRLIYVDLLLLFVGCIWFTLVGWLLLLGWLVPHICYVVTLLLDWLLLLFGWVVVVWLRLPVVFFVLLITVRHH